MERTIRHRINVTRGMTGKISWDATVEVTTVVSSRCPDYDAIERALVLDLSDKLAQELDKRYPLVSEK